MRTRLVRSFVALSFISAAGSAAAAQNAQPTNPCGERPCIVVFQWGSSSASPDPDRHFGNPSELEAMFVQGLQSGGFRIANAGQPAAMTITVRLTPQNRVICDSMSGTNSDYSCHTVSRAAVVFSANDTSVKAPPRVDVSPRCSDPVLHPTYAAFGEFAAATVVYVMLNDSKGSRPTIKCR